MKYEELQSDMLTYKITFYKLERGVELMLSFCFGCALDGRGFGGGLHHPHPVMSHGAQPDMGRYVVEVGVDKGL